MIISSPVFENNQIITDKYAFKNENISPPLEISDIPKTAQSLALIMHDPGAPAGDYTHWTFWNLSPISGSIPEGSLPPETSQGRNDFGNIRYEDRLLPAAFITTFLKLMP